MRISLLCVCVLTLSASVVNAQAVGDIRVEVTNLGNADLLLTPVWFGFHDGSFDLFDVGSPANSEIETIAELGDVNPLAAAFTAAPGIPGDIQGVVFGTDVAPPPINPGESGVAFVTPANPSAYEYFSFASMIIPSNDTFIGNDDPMQYQVFNSSDEIIGGTFTINIFGRDILDSGTEVNDGVGAAFVSGVDATLGSDEMGNVMIGSDLSAIAGVTAANGDVINDVLYGPDELVATITISQVVPEPSSFLMVLTGLLGLGLLRRRRRVNP